MRTLLTLAASLVLIVALLLTGTLARAAPPNAEPAGSLLAQAWWEDVSTQATLEEARRQTYTPFSGPLARGYTDSAHWLRLTMPAAAEPLVLRIEPPWLDALELHDPTTGAATLRAGDTQPVLPEALGGLGFAFEIAPHPVPREVWLRLQTTSTSLLVMQLDGRPQAAVARTHEVVIATGYVALMALLLVTMGLHWAARREPILRLFLLRQTVATAYCAAFLGLPTLVAPDLPPAALDFTFSLLATLALPVGIRFDMAFIGLYQPRPAARRLLQAIGWVAWLPLLLLLAGERRLALELTAFNLLATVTVLALAAATARAEPQDAGWVNRRTMRAVYAFVVFSVLAGLAGVLGLAPGGTVQIYGFIWHWLITSIAMTWILIRFLRQATLDHAQTTWQLSRAQQDLRDEQRRREQQSEFLHMLMHELKTPLAVAALALGTRDHAERNRGYAARAVEDMRAILQRCLQADRLDQQGPELEAADVDLAAVLVDIVRSLPDLTGRVQMDVAPELPQLNTDPQWLRVVLGNLLDNAVRHGDAQAPIAVSLRRRALAGRDGLVLAVSNAPGPSGPPDPAQLFRKYYRSPGARRDSGSGLGLHLAHRLAQAMGGQLSHVPEQNRVRFDLWMPLFQP